MKRTKVLMIVMTVWTEIGRDRSLIIKTMNRLSPSFGTRFPGFAEGFLCRFPYLCQTKLILHTVYN